MVTAKLICVFVFAYTKNQFSYIYPGSEGLIEDVILLGAPVSGDAKAWMPFSKIVAGKIVNGYSRYTMGRIVRKPVFAYAKTKTQISFAVTAKLISAFVFATWIVQSLFYLNPKFQASSHLLWLYSPLCVGPGRKPRRPVFSERGSNSKPLTYPCNMLGF